MYILLQNPRQRQFFAGAYNVCVNDLKMCPWSDHGTLVSRVPSPDFDVLVEQIPPYKVALSCIKVLERVSWTSVYTCNWERLFHAYFFFAER